MAFTPTSLPTSIGTGATGHIANSNAVHTAVNDLTANAVHKDSLAVNVKDYGATGDGTTNDTTAIQAAIAAAAAAIAAIVGDVRVWVLIPPGHYKITSINLPGRVGLVGNGARLSALSAAAMITVNGEANAIVGLLLLGSGASVDASGVTLASDSRWTLIESCRFDQMAGRAIYDQGVANWITRVHAQNCLLDADTFGVFTGVVETVGSDMWLTDSELTASRYPVLGASASMMACALLVNGANAMISNVVAETSDHGVYLDSGATQVSMSGVRGELNYGHGWYINGGSGRIVNPMALRNSKAGANSYNGFHVSGINSTRYVITNAWADASSSVAHNYGIFDNNISMSVFNRWVNPVDIGSSNGFFATNATGTSYLFPSNPPFNLPSGGSPVVTGAQYWIAVAGSPQTVTNLTKAVNGQRLTIKGDGNTTFAQGATITNTSGANLLLASGVWYDYIRINGVWTQI